MWDFSQGMPGPLIRLYQTWIPGDTDRYLSGEPFRELVKDGKLNLRHTYLKPFAYFHKGELPLTEWGNEMKNRDKNVKIYDWPGMGLGAEYGAILWRNDGRIALTRSRNLNIGKAVYDPASARLSVECEALERPELTIASEKAPVRLLVNGREVKTVRKGVETTVPLSGGKNRIEVSFR